jgi:DNA mismatch endonuclease, patch repair protein
MDKELKHYLKDGKFEDVLKKTSNTMSAIRGKNNKTTELRLRMALIKYSISGWKLNNKDLPGKPDFYFSKDKLAVFVDGCFWHGCPYCGHIPKTRSAFWGAKITKNKERDKKVRKKLKGMGIVTIRFWEHGLAGANISKVIKKIRLKLNRPG